MVIDQESRQLTTLLAAMKPRSPYIPALRFHVLTRSYDAFMRVVMRDRELKRRTVAALAPRPHDRILDLGCGTGTLVVMLKQTHPSSEIVGLDADPEVLALAHRKADTAGISVAWQQGMVFDPPYDAGSFDLIVSSLVFHHLTSEQKLRAASAAGRLLRPGGRFVLADFTRPTNVLLRAIFSLIRRIDSVETTEDNARGRIPVVLSQAGFATVREQHRMDTVAGTIAILIAESWRDLSAVRAAHTPPYPSTPL